jgi:DNA-binding beta-propeller fold protein YncE
MGDRKEGDKSVLYGMGRYTCELVDGWAKLPEGESFIDVGGLSIDSQDRVYVLNRGGHPVMVFDREGNLLSSWGEGFFIRPHGTCVGPDGSVYCTDDFGHTVSKFAPGGQLLMRLGTGQPSDTGYLREQKMMSIKRGGPPFNRPTGVALSSSGEIYVSDGYGNARVHKFSPDGTLLFSWGEPGTAPGQFRTPHSVRVDKQERVWVCDRENGRIQIFNDKGEFLSQWADIGGKPCDIFFGSEEDVYVGIKSAEQPHGVSIFNMDGELLTRWGSQWPPDKITDKESDLFVTPHAIVVDSRGDIYVGEIRHEMAKVDRGNRAVQKFARRA